VADDPLDLERFVQAQADVYDQALTELHDGRKRSHWMWFVFPQLRGLGLSATSQHYGIRDRTEAMAYLQHPFLGPRLRECCEAVMAVEGRSAGQIFGSPDDLKLHSCATLFAAASPPGSVFERVLGKYFGGTPDERTLRILERRDP